MTAERPLLSIITPTWQRHELLLETVANVRNQSYPNIEHIIVSDGPDPELRHVLWQAGHRPADVFRHGGPSRIQVVELGRWWTGFMPGSLGIGAILAGLLLSHGEYLTWQCDDERAEPHHYAALIGLLEAHGVDFAYPRVQFYRNGQQPEDGFQIGSDPPMHGQFTHSVFRASILKRAMPQWGTHPVDWSLCQAWMQAGASWAMLPDVTFSHRADR